LIEFYKEREKLTTIDAEGEIDEVYARLLESLK
jgi:adenylate kinase family enzyme